MILQIQENFIQKSKIHVQSSPPLQLYEVYSDGIAELWTGTSYNIFQPDSSAVLLHYQHFFSRFVFPF